MENRHGTALGAARASISRISCFVSVKPATAKARSRRPPAHEPSARHADTPMLEIDVAQVEHDGDGALSSGRARALRCGVPLEALNVETIRSTERTWLRELRAACPAFFAKRGTRRRRTNRRLEIGPHISPHMSPHMPTNCEKGYKY